MPVKSTLVKFLKSRAFKTSYVVLAFAVAMLATVAVAKPTLAASYCQCTDYVHNYFSLSGGYPNAAQWGNSYLPSNGWHTVSTPVTGGIVVFEVPYESYVSYTNGGSTFQYWIANTTAGHVGVVTAVYTRSGGQGYSIEIQSANSGLTSHYFTASNCTDVADYWWIVASSQPGTFQFWAHN